MNPKMSSISLDNCIFPLYNPHKLKEGATMFFSWNDLNTLSIDPMVRHSDGLTLLHPFIR